MQDENDSGYVFTEREAIRLLEQCGEYFRYGNDHVDGSHRMEVVARKMEADGQVDEAETLMGIHNALTNFANGQTHALQYFHEETAYSDMKRLLNRPTDNNRFIRLFGGAKTESNINHSV